MASFSDYFFDLALDALDSEANAFHICSQEPTTYTEATTTYTLGNKSAPTIGTPGDRTGGGREVELATFTDGSITATGTATHFAVVDTINSRLLATGSLSASQAVTNGNTLSITAAIAFGIGDPA